MSVTSIPAGVNPLNSEQAQAFAQLIGTMTPFQQAWLSGYLAASAQSEAVAAPFAAAPVAEAAPLTVLYGSQTGNAKHVAADLTEAAKAKGLDVKLVNMADYKPAKLKDEKFLTIVVSTYGEGEPPEPAERLYDFIASKKAPKLDGTQIAVLGLGDTSYEFFCKTAMDFEERLTALGATVVVERALLDVDYDDYAPDWINGAVETFEPAMKAAAPVVNNIVPMPGVPAPQVSTWTKKNPYLAEISAVQKITGRDSTKDVRHVEISLEGSGLSYQAGDALGVYFHNDPAEVDALIRGFDLDGAFEIQLGEGKKMLRNALIEDLELTQSYPTFVEKYADATGDEALRKLTDNKVELRDYMEPRQIYDILRDHPHQIRPQAFVDTLRKIQPRLYSIASSQAEVEEEVHLTVGVVEWKSQDRDHLGGASGYLGRRCEDGNEVRVFVEHNDLFRLPSDPDTPVIMIGPGTGIAPFRAFLQQRDADRAKGKNWLFFGNPHFTQDFLYQVELQGYLKSGLLTHLDVAFSRDQAQKVYVQDRIREKGAEVYDWLEDGAHLYICGDANRMAKDVHAAFVDVLKIHGKKDEAGAQDYLSALKDAKRYQKDVY